MEFENDYFVKPVEGKDDLFAFRHDFLLDGKALDDGSPAETVREDDNGDLIIEGWAASFEGLDRQHENFVDGAFTRGIKSFLEGQAALCYHHQHDKVIGKVLDLAEVEGKGLWMKARVDKQEPQSPLYHIYNGIKKGSIKGLSIGGFFKRALVKGRKMIADMDFTEISTTGVPVHPKTGFAVVAGKALASDLKTEHAKLDEIPEDEIREEDFERLQYALNILDETFKSLKRRDNTTNSDTRTPAASAAN